MSVVNALFAETLFRTKLLAALPPPGARLLAVAVHRNHSFELVGSVLNAFLGFWDCKAELWHSDYDDSLSFSQMPLHAHLHLIWLDLNRYTAEVLADWLVSRVQVLRDAVQGKIIVACCGVLDKPFPVMPDVLFLDMEAALAPLGERMFDSRLEEHAGTRLSNQACLRIARELGLRQFPALFLPPLKALVLDLDNTLHAGVLGEDGPDGVTPYLELQRYIVHLKERGIMLALVSKNEPEDVKALFETRKDFPLRWEDFSAVSIGWGPKSDAVRNIARDLHISTDAVLFVDDNPGETLHVSREVPLARVLEAVSPQETLAALRYYPGLHRVALSAEDALRGTDAKSNAEREHLRRALTPAEYLRELEISLTLEVNPISRSARITDLLNKTNQFILSFLRPGERDVIAAATAKDRCVISASLRDRLSDSGLIAVILARKDETRLLVEETAVSCRALGRGMEDGMLKAMLLLAGKALCAGPETGISYVAGPRNKPALIWLEALTGAPLTGKGIATLSYIPEPELDGAEVTLREDGGNA